MSNFGKAMLVVVGLSTVVIGGWWSDIFSGQTVPDKRVSHVSVKPIPELSGTGERIEQRAWLSKADKVLEELSRVKARLAKIENSSNSQQAMVVNEVISEENNLLDDQVNGLTEQGLEEEQEMLEDTALHFAKQFGQESRDSSWSSETELVISELLESDTFKETQVVSTECQTSMCRVELNVDGNSTSSEVVHELLMALPFNTQSFFHNTDDENDTEYTVVYLARKDYELSTMLR